MSLFRSFNLIALVWCFCVVVFGAYVRLSDAGLGCPDWPGCYGHIGVPEAGHETVAAEAAFPDRPVEAHKAWKEMTHRYIASTLGLIIVALAVFSVFLRGRGVPRKLPWLLVLLVCFQGVLGMWTVTWQLKPLAVTGHLLGGMTTLALLLWMLLSTSPRRAAAVALGQDRVASKGLKTLAAMGLAVVACQIFLGGWTSTNYAALACPDLPTCHGQWLPEQTNFHEAFVLWRGLGQSYEGGVLNSDARIAIHFSHRVGALVVSATLLLLAFALLRAGRQWRWLGAGVLAALTLQVVIGLSVVHWQLPLLLADAHNAGAAVLLMTLVAVNRAAQPLRRLV